ncbi:hypothetical protein TEA_029132 [Camellia sinensis var. sinensis]|uniref:Uncharacterized protein n=1 Tax=Camellia sinensis var. sinensis TaxID=542762 RepID=A0A4S4ECB9_CAMSN|nr:hypothetical protein TEA_029132 [Camellia sinensis var. sinensis]
MSKLKPSKPTTRGVKVGDQIEQRMTTSLVEGSLGRFVDEKKANQLKDKGSPIEGAVVVAGRTDKGVTALQQVCSFYTWRKDVKPEDIMDAINEAASVKFRVISVTEVSRVFHPNFCAKWRRYLYIFPLNDGEEGDVENINSIENYGSQRYKFAEHIGEETIDDLLDNDEVRLESPTKPMRGPPTECFVYHARAAEARLPPSAKDQGTRTRGLGPDVEDQRSRTRRVQGTRTRGRGRGLDMQVQNQRTRRVQGTRTRGPSLDMQVQDQRTRGDQGTRTRGPNPDVNQAISAASLSPSLLQPKWFDFYPLQFGAICGNPAAKSPAPFARILVYLWWRKTPTNSPKTNTMETSPQANGGVL